MCAFRSHLYTNDGVAWIDEECDHELDDKVSSETEPPSYETVAESQQNIEAREIEKHSELLKDVDNTLRRLEQEWKSLGTHTPLRDAPLHEACEAVYRLKSHLATCDLVKVEKKNFDHVESAEAMVRRVEELQARQNQDIEKCKRTWYRRWESLLVQLLLLL